jgi:energy-coupling factor transporter ATP-binding protein EcfA2
MRLHELHINNFKFFPEIDIESPLLSINGKNLLIYGENGSGKSTIYWALYTLLECSIKKDDKDIRKYFKKTGEDSLVNIHSTGRSDSFIKAVIKDNAGNSKTYKASRKSRDLAIRNNASAKESNMASDFLNYRVLFGLHNLKHSKSNDLFQWFFEEVLNYVKIGDEPFLDTYEKLVNGPEKYINFQGDEVYPVASLREHSNPAEKLRYRDYQAFKQSVNEWNNWFQGFLESISLKANEMIQKDFEYNFKFDLGLEKFKFEVSEQTYTPTIPKIYFKITEYNGISNPKINKPHTFLNEAKWSAIGLSIRLAILDIKLYSADLKCLVLDDMLLSLDMSNRDIVLNILLDRYVNDYQLILLTHDRYFFELCKDKIQRKGQVNNWMNLEMYEDFDTATNKGKPFIIQDNGKVDKAWILFRSKDFSSSANMVRQATEKLCNYYLTNQEKLGGDYKPMKLDGLITKRITKGTAAGLTAATLQDLKDYKDRIMNPSSHYDIEQPLFRNELKNAIETLDKLKIEIGYLDL